MDLQPSGAQRSRATTFIGCLCCNRLSEGSLQQRTRTRGILKTTENVEFCCVMGLRMSGPNVLPLPIIVCDGQVQTYSAKCGARRPIIAIQRD
jgi:hypothetical protein